ncbi:MAG: hypothetical protein AB7V77_01030 [Candidatus Woesearchaeota archaeon]
MENITTLKNSDPEYYDPNTYTNKKVNEFPKYNDIYKEFVYFLKEFRLKEGDKNKIINEKINWFLKKYYVRQLINSCKKLINIIEFEENADKIKERYEKNQIDTVKKLHENELSGIRALLNEKVKNNELKSLQENLKLRVLDWEDKDILRHVTYLKHHFEIIKLNLQEEINLFGFFKIPKEEELNKVIMQEYNSISKILELFSNVQKNKEMEMVLAIINLNDPVKYLQTINKNKLDDSKLIEEDRFIKEGQEIWNEQLIENPNLILKKYSEENRLAEEIIANPKNVYTILSNVDKYELKIGVNPSVLVNTSHFANILANHWKTEFSKYLETSPFITKKLKNIEYYEKNEFIKRKVEEYYIKLIISKALDRNDPNYAYGTTIDVSLYDMAKKFTEKLIEHKLLNPIFKFMEIKKYKKIILNILLKEINTFINYTVKDNKLDSIRCKFIDKTMNILQIKVNPSPGASIMFEKAEHIGSNYANKYADNK